jgi:hypothetical protein
MSIAEFIQMCSMLYKMFCFYAFHQGLLAYFSHSLLGIFVHIVDSDNVKVSRHNNQARDTYDENEIEYALGNFTYH